MLRSINNLKDREIQATDGPIGSVKNFFFDDHTWKVRYLVVDTGNWLSGRKVLVSPMAIGDPAWVAERLNLALTREQIEKSPGIDTDKPISRQQEEEYSGYYGYPFYWGGGSSPAGQIPMGYPDRVSVASGLATASAPAKTSEPHLSGQPGDGHLRSAKEVIGYYLEAEDGDIGHVEDFIVDDQTWSIRYMVIDTVNWWPGKKVVIAPQWIARVNWEQSKVYIDLTRAYIKRAPEFSAASLNNRDYENSLYDYYGRRQYWD